MKTLSLALLTGTMMLAAPASAAVIDFESSPATFTSYSQFGATVTAVGGGSVNTLPGSPNGSKALAGVPNGQGNYPELQAVFGSAQQVVSIDLGDFNADADGLFIEAYNAANTLLGSSTLTTLASDVTMHTLTLNFAGITKVVFGGRTPSLAGSSVYAENLTFTAAGVPEPAVWLSMIAGFGLVGAASRRKARTALA